MSPPRMSPAAWSPAYVQPNGVPAASVLAQAPVAPNPSGLQKLPYYSGLGWLLMMFGTVPELIAYVIHANTYLLYVFAPPALLGAFFSGGMASALKTRPVRLWLAFAACIFLAVPFSTWPGNSLARALDYSRFNLPLIFVAGGLVTTWKNVRGVYYTIAAGGVLNLIATRLFASNSDGRVNLDASGTIGNPNDLAAHLALVIPFMFFVVIDPKRFFLLRVAMLAAIGYGVWVMLGTASRGGMIAIGVWFLVALFYGTGRQRLIFLVSAVVLALGMPAVLPVPTLVRLGSLFTGKDAEAMESTDSRSYLLRQSIIFTLQHPIFGVGPDQFGNFEGKTRMLEGLRAEWHATHCAYTQISSECGVPALIFFVLGVTSAAATVHRTRRRARREGHKDIVNAGLCYLIAIAGFMTAITFLANGYRFYLPVMVGLAVSFGAAAAREMDLRAFSRMPEPDVRQLATRQLVAPRF